MRKTDTSEPRAVEPDDLLPEYHFDYRKARPNRFAPGIAEGSLVVVLEPEIAQVFQTPETVKAILRAIAAAMPKAREPETLRSV
jgi:hypothetical protein